MQNNIVIDLLSHYFKEEKQNTLILVLLSFIVSIIQANGISYVNAVLIQCVEHGNWVYSKQIFIYFIAVSFLFLIFFHAYKTYQTKILTKLRQWIRAKLVNLLLKSNNEDMTEINYTRINTPINRISTSCAMIFTDLFSGLLPSLTFAVIIGLYLLFTIPIIGILFLIGNVLVFSLIANNWTNMYEKHTNFEKHIVENETYLLEILNNIDKIIYRGQTGYELDNFEKRSDEATSKALQFYHDVENHGLLLNTTISALVVSCVWIALHKVRNNQVSITVFISFMTMILLYRDKMVSSVQMVPDFVEFAGRMSSMLKYFKEFQLNNLDTISQSYTPIKLEFNEIVFDKITFFYKDGDTMPVLHDFSLRLNANNHKIIGVTGLSGRGKSTLMKLLLKIYKPKKGHIYIDGVDIDNIDPEYIRQNITYVNQTGKLFDRKIIDNIMYGCSHSEECKTQLHRIMQYPKIKDLFDGIDIFNKLSGSLGENLSGGQRQVVNIIGGLINPSRILVLDEPTNALDAGLKHEILKLIKEFKSNKNAIIIVSHDKEVYSLFNEVVAL